VPVKARSGDRAFEHLTQPFPMQSQFQVVFSVKGKKLAPALNAKAEYQAIPSV
jgi:hypothetical protein